MHEKIDDACGEAGQQERAKQSATLSFRTELRTDRSTHAAVLVCALALAACTGKVPIIGDQIPDSISSARALLADEHSNQVMVVAHRSCWAEGAPENSLLAIRRCIDLGVDMIEIDVALTADGVAVLMHDSSLDRTTEGSGSVSSLSFAEVSALRLRAGAGGPAAPLTSERVPSLREALQLAKGKLLINLDVKGEAFAKAYQVVEATGVGQQILMKMVAAPEDPELRNAPFLGRTLFMPIIRECTAQTRMQACAETLGEYARGYRRFDPIAFEVTYVNEIFLRRGVEELTELGGRTWVNTLYPVHAGGITDDQALKDPEATWGHLIALGADIIQTNRPKELIEYLRRTGRR